MVDDQFFMASHVPPPNSLKLVFFILQDGPMRADFEALGVSCSAISPSKENHRERELLKQVQRCFSTTPPLLMQQIQIILAVPFEVLFRAQKWLCRVRAQAKQKLLTYRPCCDTVRRAVVRVIRLTLKGLSLRAHPLTSHEVFCRPLDALASKPIPRHLHLNIRYVEMKIDSDL